MDSVENGCHGPHISVSIFGILEPSASVEPIEVQVRVEDVFMYLEAMLILIILSGTKEKLIWRKGLVSVLLSRRMEVRNTLWSSVSLAF